MGVGGQGLSPVLPHGCSAAPSAALGYLDVRIVDTDYSSFAVVYIYKELEGALSTMVQLYSEGPPAACHPCQAPCPAGIHLALPRASPSPLVPSLQALPPLLFYPTSSHS